MTPTVTYPLGVFERIRLYLQNYATAVYYAISRYYHQSVHHKWHEILLGRGRLSGEE